MGEAFMQNDMENHDSFDRQSVAVFGHLYQLFPNETNINTSQSDTAILLTQTIEFWLRSGLIKVGQTAETFGSAAEFFFVGLTLPGLAILRSPWKNSTNGDTLGARLVELDSMSEPALIEDVNEAMAELLKYVAS